MGSLRKNRGNVYHRTTQHRTILIELKHARGTYKPAIGTDSERLIDVSSGMFAEKDWVLSVGGCRVRGTGRQW